MKLYIGCTGFSYPDWFSNKGAFYPPNIRKDELLAYYATVFPLCELNTTFYSVPKPETIKRWAESIPSDLILTAKIPKSISHSENISAHELELEAFLSSMKPLSNNLKLLIFQLPPRFIKNQENYKQLSDFLSVFPINEFPLAIEFRHKSWFETDTWCFLNEQNVGIVSSYLPYLEFSLFPEVTQSYFYLRLIGSQKQTIGKGKELIDRTNHLMHILDMLQEIGETFEKHSAYITINNHYSGYSPNTAQKLMRLAKNTGNFEVIEPKIKFFKGQQKLNKFFS